MSEGPDVLIPHQIPAESAAVLYDEITTALPDVTVTIAMTPKESYEIIRSARTAIAIELSQEQLENAERLRWLQTPSSGVDHLDLERFEEGEIIITNAAGLSAQSMAEQVLGYLTLFERNMLQGIRQQRQGIFKAYTVGGLLRDRTLGIIGVGKNGGQVAELANAIGMTVIGNKRNPETAPDSVDEIFGPDGLHEILARSDYVVLSCSLTDQTKSLIGSDELTVMKESAVLINISRPALIDEDALNRALRLGTIKGAALDQLSESAWSGSPLWDLPNLIITPGTGGQVGPQPEQPGFYERLAELFVKNYRSFSDAEFDAMENRVV